MAVGSPSAAKATEVRIFRGGPGPAFNTATDFTLSDPAPQPGERFGIVASPGDVNGNGIADLVVGAPDRGAGKGALFLFLGGTTPKLSGMIEGTIDGDHWGRALAN